MNKNFVRTLVVLICTFSSSAALFAQRTDSCSCGIPSQVPTPVIIRHVDSGFQQGALEAVNNWNQYVDVFRPTLQQGSFDFGNGVSEIYFYDLTQIFGMDGNSVLGYTPSLPQGAFGDFNECPRPPGAVCGSEMTEADVLMNNSFNWQLTRPGLGEDGTYYQATSTHELGHALGFHHNFKNVSEMNYLPHFSRYVTRADILNARQQFPGRVQQVTDLATYPFVYDERSQSGSDDGANAIKVASVTPTTVAPGGNITIKNWTVENLSNGPVSNVRLRLYLSTDTDITTSDTYFAYFYWDPSLNAWSQDADGTQFKIPSTLPAGRYYVGGIVGIGDNFQTDAIAYNNSWFIPTPISVGSGSGGGPSVCTPNATTLCALGNRFKVTVNWRDGGTGGGAANAVKYTDSTGLFWFSTADNIEMLVKVLDACGFNNRIWVFGAAATNLGYDIVVTDTHTGTTKTYHNDFGVRAAALNDTGAFATCGQ